MYLVTTNILFKLIYDCQQIAMQIDTQHEIGQMDVELLNEHMGSVLFSKQKIIKIWNNLLKWFFGKFELRLPSLLRRHHYQLSISPLILANRTSSHETFFSLCFPNIQRHSWYGLKNFRVLQKYIFINWLYSSFSRTFVRWTSVSIRSCGQSCSNGGSFLAS